MLKIIFFLMRTTLVPLSDSTMAKCIFHDTLTSSLEPFNSRGTSRLSGGGLYSPRGPTYWTHSPSKGTEVEVWGMLSETINRNTVNDNRSVMDKLTFSPAGDGTLNTMSCKTLSITQGHTIFST